MKRLTDLTRATARRLLSRAALTLTCVAALAAGLASCTADDLDTANPDRRPDATPLTVAPLPGFGDTNTPGTNTRAGFGASAPIGNPDLGKTTWAEGDTLAMQINFYADTEPTSQPFGTTYAYATYNGSAWELGDGIADITVSDPNLVNLPLALVGGKVVWPGRAKAMRVFADYAPGQTFTADGNLYTTRPEDAGKRERWTANTDLLTTPGDAIVLNDWGARCVRIRVAAVSGDVVKFAAPGFCPEGGLWGNPLSTPADGTDGKRPGEPVNYLTATADDQGNAYFYGWSNEATTVIVSLTRSILYADTETAVFQNEKQFAIDLVGQSYAINALKEANFTTVDEVDTSKDAWFITDEELDYSILKGKLEDVADADPARRINVCLLKAKNVPTQAFRYRTALAGISAPAATSIGNYVFLGCTFLTNASLPAAESVGVQAFNDCIALKTVSLPAITSIWDGMFSTCVALETASLLAATTIGENAFFDCISLTNVTLPAATSVGSNAFVGCTSLTNVSLPAATTIGVNAFLGCNFLTTVSLPSATSIGNSAFSGCTSLATLTFGTSITEWGTSVLGDDNNIASNVTLTLAAEQKAMTWNSTTSKFEASGTDAFKDFGTNKKFCGSEGGDDHDYTFKEIKKPAPAVRRGAVRRGSY